MPMSRRVYPSFAQILSSPTPIPAQEYYRATPEEVYDPHSPGQPTSGLLSVDASDDIYVYTFSIQFDEISEDGYEGDDEVEFDSKDESHSSTNSSRKSTRRRYGWKCIKCTMARLLKKFRLRRRKQVVVQPPSGFLDDTCNDERFSSATDEGGGDEDKEALTTPGAPLMKDLDSFTERSGRGSFDSLPPAETNEHGEPISPVDSLSLSLLHPQDELPNVVENWRVQVSASLSPVS